LFSYEANCRNTPVLLCRGQIGHNRWKMAKHYRQPTQNELLISEVTPVSGMYQTLKVMNILLVLRETYYKPAFISIKKH